MADHVSSKSKKKRSKNQRKRAKKTNEKIKAVQITGTNIRDDTSKSNENYATENYAVDFPEVVTSNTKLKVKSKSLDDDEDSVKIEEVTECCEGEKPECEAIVSEAESDWEETTDLRIPQKPVPLSTVAITIDDVALQRAESLSPEEELSLRNFLEGINLVNAPETPLSTSTLDTIKKEKARKRDALFRYFTPLVHNPRYLDIISEEGSDLSDREAPSLTHHLKQGTPELEYPTKISVKTSPRVFRKKKLEYKRLPKSEEKRVLVCTKLVETPSIVEHFHSCTTQNSEAEKVFLDTSSECTSSSDSEETDSKENSVPQCEKHNNNFRDVDEILKNDLVDQNIIMVQKLKCESMTLAPENKQIVEKVDSSVFTIGMGSDTIGDITNTATDKNITLQNPYDELTPPPTPDYSSENKSSSSSIDLEECMKEIAIDTAKEISLVLCKVTQNNTLTSVNPTDTHAPEKPNIRSVFLRSPSSSNSSSRGTSPSTVRLNTINSSIADVTTLLTDLELAKEALSFKQPLSLRQICLNFLLSLPCGAEILQELSDISLNLDKLTQKLNPSQKMLESDATARVLNDIEINNHESISEATKNTMWSKHWTDPLQIENKVLPNQKTNVQGSEAAKNEPDILYDLHAKFMKRKSADDINNHFRHNIEITSIQKEHTENKTNTTYYMTSSKTLPRNFKHTPNNPRLAASNLDEWLNFARNDPSFQHSNAKMEKENKNFTVEEINTSTHEGTKRINDLYKRQMQYILDKEKEIQKELEKLLEEKRRLCIEMGEPELSERNLLGLPVEQIKTTRPKSFPPSISESFRQDMYEEYMKQLAEREDRKHHKVIKITSSPGSKNEESEKPKLEATHVTGIEDEFMQKVHELHGISSEIEEEQNDESDAYEEKPFESEPVLLIDGNSLIEATSLPKHLREFVEITSNSATEVSPSDSTEGVWSPGQRQEFASADIKNHERQEKNEAIPTFWQPKSATSSPVAERKEFRPVNFESPKLGRKNKSEEVLNNSEKSASKLFWQDPVSNSDTGIHLSSTVERHRNSRPALPVELNDHYNSTPRLPRAQNPTVTLLQKAREGQLPRGANYLEANRDHYRIPHEPGRHGEIIQPRKADFYSESDSEISRRMVDSSRRKIEGVGPITRDGMPLSLRSEVRDSNQSKWYKKMYDTIHKQKPYKDEYVTVRYKQRRAQYPYITGYLSEPEPGAYDSDHMDYKYATLDRRRTPISEKENFSTSTMPRNAPLKSSSTSDFIHHTPGSKQNPGRIENYTPGHSSISDQESKRWWDEVMDIFDGWMDDVDDFQSLASIPNFVPNFEEEKRPITKGYMSQALKESGYESDSTLIFRRKEDGNRLSPSEQKEAYKIIQKGGDIPLHGLRKLVPEPRKEPEPPLPPPKGHHGPKEPQQGSPRKYVENQVTIHYKTPVRQEIKEYYSEDELAHRQQEAMKKIYQEERRRKYLQELQDMHNRRHTDNFIPSQKSPIALNRYDDFDNMVAPQHKIRPRSPEPRLVARALYNFVGMTPRELTFRKGDNIYVRRQIDKNWYEGELNAMVGLFPVNYVEIVPYDNVRTTPRKPHEGQARAKYNFLAKTHLELSLAKGEMVIITRRVDNNWYEGKIGGRRGIFPASYVDILIDPQEGVKDSPKPVASPAAHSLLLNGSGARESMGSHTYTPNLQNPEPAPAPSYFAKPVQVNYCNNYGNRNIADQKNPMSQALHIDTQSAEPTPFKALYKYLPQNDDELELMEGDTVYVLEQCDDGWFVGSNERTGAFGTFPGNYVDKV